MLNNSIIKYALFCCGVEIDDEAERDNQINEHIMNAEVAQPKVVPPRDTKAQLYSDPNIFREFDTRARKVGCFHIMLALIELSRWI